MYVGLPSLADPGDCPSEQPWGQTLGAETTAKVGLCDTRFKFGFGLHIAGCNPSSSQFSNITSSRSRHWACRTRTSVIRSEATHELHLGSMNALVNA